MDGPRSIADLAARGSAALGKYFAHEDRSDSTQAVIVALPHGMDSVRLVGDEEKHATLLYFGETSTLPDEAKEELLGTLEQVSHMVEPFSERIVEVARLGDDDPPALVSMLSNHQLGSIRDIMQVNPKIKGYLSNATQHLSYTPHVTLAYPDYKGEAEIRQQVVSLRRVQFDRLALWWNNERHEFPLKYLYEGDSPTEAGWSTDLVESYLAHYGVKGMKWGVRRSRKQLDAASEDATKAAAAKAVIKKNKGKTDPLSNKDLKALVERMNLEQNYSRLAAQSKKKSVGRKFAEKLVKDKKTQQQVTGGLKMGKAAVELGAALGKVKLT